MGWIQRFGGLAVSIAVLLGGLMLTTSSGRATGQDKRGVELRPLPWMDRVSVLEGKIEKLEKQVSALEMKIEQSGQPKVIPINKK